MKSALHFVGESRFSPAPGFTGPAGERLLTPMVVMVDWQ